MNTWIVRLHADPENPVEVVAETAARAHAVALRSYEEENGTTPTKGGTMTLKKENQ